MQNENHPRFIERIISLGQERPISLNIQFLKLSNTDNNILSKEILKNQQKIFGNFTIKEIEPNLLILADKVRENTNKANNLNANITGKNLENIKTYTEISYNRFYLSPIYLNYLIKPNSFFFKGNMSLFNNRFSINPNSKIKEDELSGCLKFSQIGPQDFKKSFFFSNIVYSDKLEIETKFKYSSTDIDIKRKQTNNSIKATISKNFVERPFLFRENLNFDHFSKINLQYSHKSIRNEVDELNCPNEYIAKIPLEDSQHQLKVFYVLNKSMLENGDVVFLKASSSLVNSLNSTFLKNKIFWRKFFIFDPITYQINLEFGNVVNLKEGYERLRIHERLFVKNFRGIENPSEKILSNEGRTGDSLGVNNYLMLQNKIIINNIPLLSSKGFLKSGWQINPFLHFNFLFTPNSSHFQDLQANRKNLYDAFRFSAGCGVSFITKYGAIEFYYNAFVQKSESDLKNEFSIRFGLD